MSLLGVGVDLVENARIKHSLDRFGERFLQRIFTAGEIEYCQSMKFSGRHFAARFAAKEAVSKAFGIGSAMGWKDIDVHRKRTGEPFVVLAGGAKKIGQERGVTSVWITLSHTEHHGMAMIVVESESGSGAPRTMAADGGEAASI
jgi:holo-[acyl-carrier protein] synthase